MATYKEVLEAAESARPEIKYEFEKKLTTIARVEGQIEKELKAQNVYDVNRRKGEICVRIRIPLPNEELWELIENDELLSVLVGRFCGNGIGLEFDNESPSLITLTIKEPDLNSHRLDPAGFAH